LSARRDRPAFDEAETQRRKAVDMFGILVEAGGDADSIGKAKAHRRHRRRRRRRNEKRCDAQFGRGIEARERCLVRGLGIEREQQRSAQGVEHRRRAPAARSSRCGERDGRRPMIPFACSISSARGEPGMLRLIAVV
jgi:hypothetical protein